RAVIPRCRDRPVPLAVRAALVGWDWPRSEGWCSLVRDLYRVRVGRRSLCDYCIMVRRSGSIKLFDLFGIRIGVDASWFLVLFLMIFWLSTPFRATLHSSDGVAYMTTVITVLLFFGSLILHELVHAIVARR